MIRRLRQHFINEGTPGKQYLITGSPQCPIPEPNMLNMIQGAKFDALWVQFYNNDAFGCTAHQWSLNNPDYSKGSSENVGGFNFDQWASDANLGASAGAKIYIGLLGSKQASSFAPQDYLEPSQLKDIVHAYQGHAQFGGVMIWEATYAQNNKIASQPYYDFVKEVLLGLDPPTSSTTTSSSTTSSSSTGSSSVMTTTRSTISSSSMTTTLSTTSSLLSTTSRGSSTSSSMSQASSTSQSQSSSSSQSSSQSSTSSGSSSQSSTSNTASSTTSSVATSSLSSSQFSTLGVSSSSTSSITSSGSTSGSSSSSGSTSGSSSVSTTTQGSPTSVSTTMQSSPASSSTSATSSQGTSSGKKYCMYPKTASKFMSWISSVCEPTADVLQGRAQAMQFLYQAVARPPCPLRAHHPVNHSPPVQARHLAQPLPSPAQVRAITFRHTSST